MTEDEQRAFIRGYDTALNEMEPVLTTLLSATIGTNRANKMIAALKEARIAAKARTADPDQTAADPEPEAVA